jgi:hypothetical protein
MRSSIAITTIEVSKINVSGRSQSTGGSPLSTFGNWSQYMPPPTTAASMKKKKRLPTEDVLVKTMRLSSGFRYGIEDMITPIIYLIFLR